MGSGLSVESVVWAGLWPGEGRFSPFSSLICGLLDLPGVQVRSCMHTPPVTLRAADRREVSSKIKRLKGHHSLIPLGPVCCIDADQYCTLVRILNTGLSHFLKKNKKKNQIHFF